MTVERFLTGLAILVLAGPASAADPPAKVSFAKDILPIFNQNCLGCHQPAMPKGGYVMTSRDAMLKMGDTAQPGIVPGKPDESNVFSQITSQQGKPPVMPKGKPALLAKDVALIRTWIAQGAVDDRPPTTSSAIDDAHPPVYTSPPVLTSLAYSPDGTLLAVSGYHEALVHKSDGSGTPARLVGVSEQISSVAFSPDGKQLAVAGGSPGRFGEIQVWDLAKKELKLSQMVTADTLYGVSWSPDGKLIAFGCSDNSMRAIESTTGKQVVYQGAHTDWVLDTVFSRDGEYIASVSRDMTIKLTEVATQRFIDNVTSITPGVLKGGLQAVALRPFKERDTFKETNVEIGDITKARLYEELLIGGSDGVPRLYRMHRLYKRVIGDDSNKVMEFEALPGRIFALAFAPDAQQFAAASSLDGKGEVRIYKAPPESRKIVTTVPRPPNPPVYPGELSKKVTVVQGQKGPVYSLVFSPDGKTLASAGFDGVIRLNEVATGKVVKEFDAVPLKK